MKKYIIGFISVTRLIFFKYLLRLNVNFHYLQSHSLSSEIKVNKKAKLVLAKNTQLSADCDIFLGKGALIEIGERTFFNKRCMVSAHKEIIIGRNCLFGPDVKIYDNNHVIKAGAGVVHGEHSSKAIYIGNNCWLASNVVVLAGATIEDNCVIGAGVIIKGHVPANSIVKTSTSNQIVQIL